MILCVHWTLVKASEAGTLRLNAGKNRKFRCLKYANRTDKYEGVLHKGVYL